MPRHMLAVAALALGVLFGFAHLASAQTMAKEGESCGGFTGAQCAKGLWCDPLVCGGPTIGKCVTVPQICTQDYQPVCGCDGKTYSNDCARQAAQVGRLHRGACFGDWLRAKPK